MANQRSKTSGKASVADRYLQVLSRTQTMKLPMTYQVKAGGEERDINQEIARAQKIKNDDAEQDISLKRKTLNRLFIFLGVETACIFLLAFFQAVHWPGHFHLEEWSFKLLITATILQITGMLYLAVRYLFPKGK